MSRAKIGGVVAIVVAALTATAYFLTTSSLESRIKRDVTKQVGRSRDLMVQNAKLRGVDLTQRAGQFAEFPAFAAALATEGEPKALEAAAGAATQQFRQCFADNAQPPCPPKSQGEAPAFIALVNAEGRLVGMDPGGIAGYEGNWKQYPAVVSSIDAKEARAEKDIGEWDGSVMEFAAAPIVDQASQQVRGAVVIAYALDAADAKAESELLGSNVAYFRGDKIFAMSYGRSGGAEDKAISEVLFKKGLAKTAIEKGVSTIESVTVGDVTYLVSAAKMPFNASDTSSGAVVLVSLSDAQGPVASVKVTILLLGIGALVIAILAMLVTARLILNPAEEIELGVTEIINGNIDYTFKPVGADFDGLANALNVMLARLLGRPEPGEEEYDEDGNVVTSGKVLLDDAEGGQAAAMGGAQQAATDPETLALAQEAEADYYRRIFGEYTEARKANGEKVEGVTFEGFVAKLRLNEGNLKKKYSCRAVRFRVQRKDGQVTLKPVPIL